MNTNTKTIEDDRLLDGASYCDVFGVPLMIWRAAVSPRSHESYYITDAENHLLDYFSSHDLSAVLTAPGRTINGRTTINW